MMNGSVTIINYNTNAHNIVAAAGRISTTKGCANEIYENSCHNKEESNINLISKILESGHESVLEHISINLSFDNVSVFVEQFLIEFRLASFTVKSRRYVDFSKMGFVSPDFTKYKVDDTEKLNSMYQSHMEYLFSEYNYFIQEGIPKEDARFVLPYSFRSNFYCTVNARELVKIMNEMVDGRGKDYPELVALGESLFLQCEKSLPYLVIKKKLLDMKESIIGCFERPNSKMSENMRTNDLVTLVAGTEYPERIVCKAAALNYGIENWSNLSINDAGQQKTIIKELLKNSRKRELEQVNFTVIFNRISLAGVTHLVRHRMQSIIIPEYIRVCNYENYIIPESIINSGLAERYKTIFEKTKQVVHLLDKEGMCVSDHVYLLLSGLTVPVMTTMNANEIFIFIKLRTCNRAQWEIKECGDSLLKLLREKYPILFSSFGPSCYSTGQCPEGRMTCGQMQEVCRAYGHK